MLTTKKVYFLTIISGALPCRSIAQRGLELQSPHVMGSYEYTYSDAKEQNLDKNRIWIYKRSRFYTNLRDRSFFMPQVGADEKWGG